MGKMLKNILLDIKSKSLLNTLIIAFIIALFINPLAKLTWKLLFSMSDRFSLFLINQIIGLILRGTALIEIDIFMFVFFIFIFLFVSPLTVKIKRENTNNKIKKIPVRKIAITILYIEWV